jgi:F0F1-type ATP synthase membrane subunit b/b'
VNPTPDSDDLAASRPPLDQLDEVTALLAALRRRVSRGKAVPMSASVMVNKKDLLADLDALAEAVSKAFDQARTVAAERDAVIAEGRAQAERLLEQARAEQTRLVAGDAVHERANSAAEEMVGTATERAAQARTEVDDYVDRKLATFEVVLTRALTEVTEGRRQLAETDAPGSGPTSPARRALRALARGEAE